MDRLLEAVLTVDPASFVAVVDGRCLMFEKGAGRNWLNMVNAMLAQSDGDACFDGEEMQDTFIDALKNADSRHLPIWAAVPGIPGVAVCRRHDLVFVCMKARVYCMALNIEKEPLLQLLKKHAACMLSTE